MEVVVQSPGRSPSSTMDNFDLSSIMISPYLSAPSSPKRFGEYYSEFYQEFGFISSSSSNIPFEALTENVDEDDEDAGDDGFAFYVNDDSDTWSRSAEELFDGGKIKPLEPEGNNEIISSKKTTTLEEKKNESLHGVFISSESKRRGRDRTPTSSVLSTSNSGRRVTRSHSPYRKSWEEEHHSQQQQQQQQQPRINKDETTLKSTSSFSNSRAASSSSSKGSKRWRLKDFILFRSISEGRGSTKESFKKESVGFKKGEDGSASMRRKGPISAHEMHYTLKKAESEDLKKRTFLPYKQGILGRLAGFGL
ncbi:hypothetical protein RIF29_06049 [Crotalaria pallida]|uniref:Uncharacterized protein n=1 Tax=Crotalaria pallida TaxID=3830 RepID=A0AAN9PBA6_CROPI